MWADKDVGQWMNHSLCTLQTISNGAWHDGIRDMNCFLSVIC